jgi:hypothetical protein
LRCKARWQNGTASDFNIAHFGRPGTECHVWTQKPTLRENMTSTRIEFAFNRTARLGDSADLAELLFPGQSQPAALLPGPVVCAQMVRTGPGS